MSEYVIEMIDSEPAKRWDGPNGTVWYKNVGLGGHPKPVSIGKKTPDALKVGDTVYGTIVPTDYLTDKWKGEAKPPTAGNPGNSGSTENKFQRDVTALSLDVYRVVANIRGLPENADDSAKFWDIVMTHTNELLNMINKVRNGGSETAVPTPSVGPTQVETASSQSTATPPSSGLLGNAYRNRDKAISYDDPPEEEG